MPSGSALGSLRQPVILDIPCALPIPRNLSSSMSAPI